MSRAAPVSRGMLTKVGAGLLFLQAAFNPERRQGIGVAAALAPVARLWKDRRDRRAFFLRHLENFNTNPAMAGPILGAVVRLEEDAATGNAAAAERRADRHARALPPRGSRLLP